MMETFEKVCIDELCKWVKVDREGMEEGICEKGYCDRNNF